MHEFGPAPPSQEPSNRESAVLPASYAEQDQWQSFAEKMYRHRAFWQLVITLAHCIVASGIRWNAAAFQDMLSPRPPQQKKRYTALLTVERIANSPPEKPIEDLQLTGEELQAFMRPLLPENHTPMRMIASELEKLGIHPGSEELSARRRQLRTALRHHRFQSGLIHVAMNFGQLREYHDLTAEMLLDLGLNTPFIREVVSIVAISRSGLASFLNNWSETLEAEDLMNKVHAEIEEDSLHESNTDIHKRRLLLLVAGYEIQRHFLPGEEQTANEAYLPPDLSREGPYQYKHAAFWYAHTFGRQSLLGVFAPSLSSKTRAIGQTERRWKDYWLRRFPPNWGSNSPPGATLSPEASNQHSGADEKSFFEFDDSYTTSYTAWISKIRKYFTECLPIKGCLGSPDPHDHI
ncbi:hypothetical protein LTS17_012876 [Exophiala oligosperma]